MVEEEKEEEVVKEEEKVMVEAVRETGKGEGNHRGSIHGKEVEVNTWEAEWRNSSHTYMHIHDIRLALMYIIDIE